MKVCIIQPAYSTDYARSEEYFNAQIALGIDAILTGDCQNAIYGIKKWKTRAGLIDNSQKIC